MTFHLHLRLVLSTALIAGASITAVVLATYAFHTLISSAGTAGEFLVSATTFFALGIAFIIAVPARFFLQDAHARIRWSNTRRTLAEVAR